MDRRNKVAILSNINTDPLVRLLSKEEGLEVYAPEGYGGELGALLNPSSALNEYAPDTVSDAAHRYSRAANYHDEALAALDEMVAQVGEPVFGEHRWTEDGIEMVAPLLTRGVIVRHLVLPGRVDDSRYVVRELWERYGNRVLYSFMSQYTPVRDFPQLPELNRPTSAEEYEALLDFADELGLEDYFWQEGDAALESFIPAWDGTGVR